MTRRPGRPRWSTVVLAVVFAGSVAAYLYLRPQPTPTGYIGHQRPVATLIPSPGTRSTTTSPSAPPTTAPGPTTTVTSTPTSEPGRQPAPTTTVPAVGPTTTTSAPPASTTTVAPGASTSSTTPGG